MATALYGPGGFYRLNSPNAHFRTSASASPLLAASLVPLVLAVDHALDSPGRVEIVDVGAGDGGLLVELMKVLPADLAGRVEPVAVEIRPRPTELPTQISWTEILPSDVNGLVLAHEYLDNVPCDVVEVGGGGSPQQVLVDEESGAESFGPELSPEQSAWVERWWPLAETGDRAEVGTIRDQTWAQLVGSLSRGLAVAVDYGHLRDDRAAGSYVVGTLTGYRDGRQVVPVPNGSCDITAHVAMDACEQAGRDAGADASALISQAGALRALGLDARRPPIELAHADPHAYIEGVSRASHAAELLDPASLGSFWWLLQAKNCLPRLDGIEWS